MAKFRFSRSRAPSRKEQLLIEALLSRTWAKVNVHQNPLPLPIQYEHLHMFANCSVRYNTVSQSFLDKFGPRAAQVGKDGMVGLRISSEDYYQTFVEWRFKITTDSLHEIVLGIDACRDVQRDWRVREDILVIEPSRMSKEESHRKAAEREAAQKRRKEEKEKQDAEDEKEYQKDVANKTRAAGTGGSKK